MAVMQLCIDCIIVGRPGAKDLKLDHRWRSSLFVLWFYFCVKRVMIWTKMFIRIIRNCYDKRKQMFEFETSSKYNNIWDLISQESSMHSKWISSCTFYRTLGHVFVVQQHIICIFVIRRCQLQARLLFHRFNDLPFNFWAAMPGDCSGRMVCNYPISLNLTVFYLASMYCSTYYAILYIHSMYYIHPTHNLFQYLPIYLNTPPMCCPVFYCATGNLWKNITFTFLQPKHHKEIIHLANVLQFKSRDPEVLEVIWRNVSTQLWIPPMFVDPIMTSITSWLFFEGDESHGDWHQSAMTSGAPQAPTDPTDTPEKLKSLLRAPLSPQKLKQNKWPPRTHQKISKVILSSSPNRAKIKTPHSKFESN